MLARERAEKVEKVMGEVVGSVPKASDSGIDGWVTDVQINL